MAAAFVTGQAASSAGNGNRTAAFPGNNTAGNAIIVAAAWDSSTPATDGAVTDTQGNSYSIARQYNPGRSIAIWYAVNISAGANTVTFAPPGNSDYTTIAVAEYSGIQTTTPATDGDAAGAASGTGTDALTSGNFTPTTNGDLIVGAVDNTTGWNLQTYTKGSAFTAIRTYAGGNYVFIALEDFVQATAGQTAATFTQSADLGNNVIAAAFKASVAAAGNPWYYYAQQ